MSVIIHCVLSVLGSSAWEETKDTKVTFSVFFYFFFNVYILSSTFEMKFWLLVIFADILLSFLFTICFAFHPFLSSCCGNYLVASIIHRPLLK